MATIIPYNIFPLGDSALTVEFGNLIDETINRQVLSLFHELARNPFPGFIEGVPSYSSFSVYYDPARIDKKHTAGSSCYAFVSAEVEKRLKESTDLEEYPEGEIVRIPVCYEGEWAPDIESLATNKGISVADVIRIHSSSVYRVYMLGFLPGFAYMGQVDERISMARKPQPAVVAPGSVGIAGRQTGIYPLTSPGGWSIIGRTPLVLFNKDADPLTLLKTGDRVQFFSISSNEFKSY